ncbi:hypothetical protein D4764_11G0008990 [Takifugu flavidus]|uniref:Uncharacterized protein n=1 Tax=Takifugu flavidus TaxID=433684 RepID=A0A5C6PJ95_9TELE|nr:hypothetical protein D4764_11G0008990 [Takifugu flavidus]
MGSVHGGEATCQLYRRKYTMVYIPSFDGTSYLELRPLSYMRQSSGSSSDLRSPVQDTTMTLSLSVKTKETQGTILYSERKQNI